MVPPVGETDGAIVGLDGDALGLVVGLVLGLNVGAGVASEGETLGDDDGLMDGDDVGSCCSQTSPS